MKQIVPVYPWPMHPKVAEVLEKVPNIKLVEALPGGPGPVLAIRKAPPFACDAIVVLSPQGIAQAIDIVIENGVKLMTMSEVLGYKELQPEYVEPKVSFK